METYCDVLRAISSGAEKPTHIMFKANLSWTIMQGYLKSLLAQGLIVIENTEEKSVYRITEKGIRLLQQFLSIREDLRISSDEF